MLESVRLADDVVVLADDVLKEQVDALGDLAVCRPTSVPLPGFGEDDGRRGVPNPAFGEHVGVIQGDANDERQRRIRLAKYLRGCWSDLLTGVPLALAGMYRRWIIWEDR